MKSAIITTCGLIILALVTLSPSGTEGSSNETSILAALQGEWLGSCSQYGAMLVRPNENATTSCLPYDAPMHIRYNFFALFNGSNFMFSTTGAMKNVSVGSETYTWEPSTGNVTVLHISPFKNTSVFVVQGILNDSSSLIKFQVSVSEVNGTAVYKQSGVVDFSEKDHSHVSPSNAHPGKDESLVLRCDKKSFSYTCTARPVQQSTSMGGSA
jgi:hypothetical protein